jgi:hypothetical protein
METISISYAHEDQAFTLEIYDSLQEKGLSPWLDVKKLLPGQEWKLEIEKAIRDSTIFIACLSKNSVDKKGFVQAELKRALDITDLMPEGKIYIIPVRLDDCEVPTRLSKFQWVDYFNPGDREKLFDSFQNYHRASENRQPEQFFDAGRE